MTETPRTLEIRSSPHIRRGHSVDVIMFHVVLALLPTAAFAVWAFGITGAATLLTAVAACVVTEHVLSRSGGRFPPLHGSGAFAI